MDAPEAELQGSALDELFEAMEEENQDARLKNHQPTMDEIQKQVQQMGALERQSSILPASGGPVWMRKLLHMVEDFIHLHRVQSSPLAEFGLARGERERTTIVRE